MTAVHAKEDPYNIPDFRTWMSCIIRLCLQASNIFGQEGLNIIQPFVLVFSTRNATAGCPGIVTLCLRTNRANPIWLACLEKESRGHLSRFQKRLGNGPCAWLPSRWQVAHQFKMLQTVKKICSESGSCSIKNLTLNLRL